MILYPTLLQLKKCNYIDKVRNRKGTVWRLFWNCFTAKGITLWFTLKINKDK